MKDKKMVVVVRVEMHVSYSAEPGKERELLRDIRRAAKDIPYCQVTAGALGSFSMSRKVNGKHR